MFNLKWSQMLLLQLLVICLVNYVAASDSQNKSSQNIQISEEEVSYTEQYRNPNYFYSIGIPQGYTCIGDPAPNPNHGCRIVLSENPEVYLYVDGSYNSTDFNTPRDAIIRLHLASILQKGMEIVVLEQSSTTLDGLAAEQLAIRYQQKDHQEASIKDIVVAFRTKNSDTEMIYTIGLQTTQSRYEQDKELFNLILTSWKNE